MRLEGKGASLAARLLQLHKCSKFQMHKCTNAQMQKCTHAQVLRYPNAQMQRCANAQVLKCTSAQMIRCLNAQIHKCTSKSKGRCNLSFQSACMCVWAILFPEDCCCCCNAMQFHVHAFATVVGDNIVLSRCISNAAPAANKAKQNGCAYRYVKSSSQCRGFSLRERKSSDWCNSNHKTAIFCGVSF